MWVDSRQRVKNEIYCFTNLRAYRRLCSRYRQILQCDDSYIFIVIIIIIIISFLYLFQKWSMRGSPCVTEFY